MEDGVDVPAGVNKEQNAVKRRKTPVHLRDEAVGEYMFAWRRLLP